MEEAVERPPFSAPQSTAGVDSGLVCSVTLLLLVILYDPLALLISRHVAMPVGPKRQDADPCMHQQCGECRADVGPNGTHVFGETVEPRTCRERETVTSHALPRY